MRIENLCWRGSNTDLTISLRVNSRGALEHMVYASMYFENFVQRRFVNGGRWSWAQFVEKIITFCATLATRATCGLRAELPWFSVRWKVVVQRKLSTSPGHNQWHIGKRYWSEAWAKLKIKTGTENKQKVIRRKTLNTCAYTELQSVDEESVPYLNEKVFYILQVDSRKLPKIRLMVRMFNVSLIFEKEPNCSTKHDFWRLFICIL